MSTSGTQRWTSKVDAQSFRGTCELVTQRQINRIFFTMIEHFVSAHDFEGNFGNVELEC